MSHCEITALFPSTGQEGCFSVCGHVQTLEDSCELIEKLAVLDDCWERLDYVTPNGDVDCLVPEQLRGEGDDAPDLGFLTDKAIELTGTSAILVVDLTS